MSRTRTSSRARLINAALELFTSQGVTETTTRQIAELAQVNEVTLFRQFGNKQGLLLAVIEDSAVRGITVEIRMPRELIYPQKLVAIARHPPKIAIH